MLNCILIQRNIFRILLRIFTRKWKRIQKTLGHVVIRKPQFLVILFAGINSILSIAYQKKKIYDHLRNKIHPIAQDQSERKPPAQPYHTELNPAHKMKHGIARAFDYTDPRPLIRRARNEHATILVRLSIRDWIPFPFFPLSLSPFSFESCSTVINIGETM